MNAKKKCVLAALLAAFSLGVNAETNRVSIPAPNGKPTLREQTRDLRALIARQLAAGKKTIIIPPGRYRETPAGGSHLSFHDLQGVKIIADHVEMDCAATVQAIGFDHCTNVTLRGLTVDYNPLPFTEGKIVALGPDKSWVEFEIFDGYPENQLRERIEIFDPATRELRRASYYGWGAFERTGPHRYRISKGKNYHYHPNVDTEQVGDILVTNNRTPDRGGPHAVILSDCVNVKLEAVTLYASPMFGFFETGCRGSTYLRCKIERRAPDDDPVQRAYPRMRSLNADAFHSADATQGPAIIGCTAHFQGDDCVNIHGRYYYVAGGRGNQLRLVTSRQPAIMAGDPVAFLPYDGPRPPDAVAVRIEPDADSLTMGERTFINKLNLVESVRRRFLGGNAKVYRLTLDRDVNLPEGSAVCSANRIGNGFVVKNCDFGDNRSRGILIKASHGEVTDNRITKSRMSAVLISPEFEWLEAGCSSDVIVKGNVIHGCGQTPIRILADGGNGKPLPAGAHCNISVLNNRFEDCPWPLVEVTSVSGLTVTGNVWPKQGPSGSSANKPGKPAGPVLLMNCEQTSIRQ